MSVAEDHMNENRFAAARCGDNLDETRRLVGELMELAEAARSGCDQDACHLLYGVVEDCCLRIRSVLDWRSQRMLARQDAGPVDEPGSGTAGAPGPKEDERPKEVRP